MEKIGRKMIKMKGRNVHKMIFKDRGGRLWMKGERNSLPLESYGRKQILTEIIRRDGKLYATPNTKTVYDRSGESLISLWVSDELKMDVQKIAKSEGLSNSAWIRRLIIHNIKSPIHTQSD